MGNKASAPGQAGDKSRASGSISAPGNTVVAADSDMTQMDIVVEFGGAKGWSMDATVVYYHKAKGIICVGTSGGAICCYGAGFQYFRQWFQAHENEVTSIHYGGPDRIIVGFGDNSMVVLSLPTLNICDLVECTWISEQAGDIITVHVDESAEKGFFYVGTTEGLLLVLESSLTSGAIRVCDYSVNWNEAGLTKKMAISSIQMCPKDDKYIAIGYDGDTEGAVIIFDLVKKKPHRVYETAAVTSLTWTHTGDQLYAGTRTGDVLLAYVEKASCASVWNSSSVERRDNDADEERDDDNVVIIRRVDWFVQQQGTNNTAGGCLFVLLGAFGDSSSEMLQSVLIGLMPEGGVNGDRLCENMCIPPLNNEDIVGFRLIPSIDKSLIKVSAGGDVNNNSANLIPALLMVTQSVDDNGSVLRQLKLMRCSASADVRDWALEIGMLADPRSATEVLLGNGAGITSIVGMIPPVPGSIGNVLLARAPLDESVLNMLKKTTISESKSSSSALEEKNKTDKWEMVLSSGTPEDPALITKPLNVVITGYNDGSIVAWGVSKSNDGDACGKGTVWLPLRTFAIGTSEITKVVTDGIHLLAAGDVDGHVVVWETFDQKSGNGGVTSGGGLGRYPYFNSTTHNSIVYHPADSDSVAIPASTLTSGSFHPQEIRPACKVNIGETVTCIALIGEATVMFIGGESGTLFSVCDWVSGKLQSLEAPEFIGASGPIVHVMYSSFCCNGLAVPAMYAFHGSGHVLVWHMFTLELISYCSGPDELYNDVDESFHVLYAHVLDADGQPLHRPDPFAKPKPKPKVAEVTPPPPPVAVEDPGAAGKKFFEKVRSGMVNGVNAVNAANSLESKFIPVIPRNEATTLVVIGLHAVLSYDLAKFSLNLKYTPDRDKGFGLFTATVPNAATSKFLSADPIVTAQCTIFVEEAARAYAEPLPCVSCISTEGNLLVLSLKTNQLMSDGEIALLAGVERRPVRLEHGSLLPNGDSYLISSELMVYCTSFSSHAYVHSHAQPTRSGVRHVAPPASWQFKTGREDKQQASKKAAAKRRTSILTLSAPPTDLSKIFVKTRTDWEREELFGTANDEEEQRRRDALRASSASSAIKGAAATKYEMDEVRRAFEERGERLKRINERMEHFQEAAKEFKNNAAEQKERMRLKNERWGVF